MVLKKGTFLKPQAFALTDSPGTGDDLVAYTWKGKTIKSVDRNHLPFYPTVGMGRVIRGEIPDGSGVTLAVEPTPNWGQQGATLKVPRAAFVVGFQGQDPEPVLDVYDTIAADAAFMAKLSAAGVALVKSGTSGRNPFPADWLPCDAAGDPQTTLDGGDFLLVYCGPFLSSANSGGRPDVYDTLGGSDPVHPVWALTPFWSAALATLSAVLPKFRNFGMRLYLTTTDLLGLASYEACCTQAGTDLASVGVAGAYLGVDLSADVYTLVEADIQTFFGIT